MLLALTTEAHGGSHSFPHGTGRAREIGYLVHGGQVDEWIGVGMLDRSMVSWPSG